MISRNGLSAVGYPLSADAGLYSRKQRDIRLQTSDNQTPLPADWYLPTDESLAAFTEILRFAETLHRGSESAEVGP